MNNLFSPTYLKQLCATYGFEPTKQYGQHYLLTLAHIEKMCAAADLQPHDTIIEIGPGFGTLTFALAEKVKRVISFEIEQVLRPYWEEEMKTHPNVEIVWGNALNRLPSTVDRLQTAYKVVANLPYQITSHALRIILEASPAPERAVVMVQREVAERVCEKPGEMSLLSVSVQYYGKPRIAAHVPRGAFWPVPKVDSAVLAIEHIRQVPKEEAEQFFRVVHAGFASKRKQLGKQLADSLSLGEGKVKNALIDICGSDRARAQELSVDVWQKLVERLCS